VETRNNLCYCLLYRTLTVFHVMAVYSSCRLIKKAEN